MSGFWLLERIGLHRLDIFLTKALNREEKWAEFRLDTDREVEWRNGGTIRPFEIRFYYTGDKLKHIALEGAVGREHGGGTTAIYYDREEDVPKWILDMVEDQIQAAAE